MAEYVNEDGEIIEEGEPDQRTPYQVAKSDLAAFKFKLIDTVRADPRLSAAPCLAVVSVYLGFVTIDKRTLKPTTAYASNIKLMALASIKSKTTARAARKLLVKFGYLVSTGETKDGCEKFRVENPHVERVQMHVRETEEYLKQVEAARREDERRKKKLSQPDRGSDIDPTRDEGGVNNWPDRGSDIDPNYLRGNLSGLGSEERDLPIKVSSVPSYGDEDSGDYAFPIPANEAEGEMMLDEMLSGTRESDPVRRFFRQQLFAGEFMKSTLDAWRNANAA